ncbi:MAG TPA: hypothetical protein VGO47_11110 [Chlamydiales bacterium]|nr:hypothetical protein [Chlamydiales bacterium]
MMPGPFCSSNSNPKGVDFSQGRGPDKQRIKSPSISAFDHKEEFRMKGALACHGQELVSEFFANISEVHIRRTGCGIDFLPSLPSQADTQLVTKLGKWIRLENTEASGRDRRVYSCQ